MSAKTVMTVKKQVAMLKSVLTYFMRNNMKSDFVWCAKITQKMVEFAGYDMTAGVNVPDTGLAPTEQVIVSFMQLNAALTMDSSRFSVQKTEDTSKVSINGVICAALANVDTVFSPAHSFAKDVEFVLDVPLPSWDLIGDIRLAESVHDVRYYLNGTYFDLGKRAIVCTDGHRMHLANSTTLPEFTIADLHRLCAPQHVKEKHEDYEERLSRFSGIIVSGITMSLLQKISVKTLRVSQNVGSEDLRYVQGVGDYGYVVGKTIEARFPDYKRVHVGPDKVALWKEKSQAGFDPALYELRLREFSQASLALEQVGAQLEAASPQSRDDHELRRSTFKAAQRRMEDAKREWNDVLMKSPAYQGPKTIKFASNAFELLAAYGKALKPFKVKFRQVVVDFNIMAIRPVSNDGAEWSSIPLHVPFELVDGEVPADCKFIVGVNIDYLIDALASIPDAQVVVGGDTSEYSGLSFLSGDGIRGARVMACRV
jgi:hypothetical protein